MTLPITDPRRRFELLVENWKDCTRCELCKGRMQVVHYRGAAVCDMVFVGEAPGPREDEKGLPFWGPAGNYLNQMIAAALEQVVPIGWEFDEEGWQLPIQKDEIVRARTLQWPKLGFANLVGCFPNAEGKIVKPPKESIDACKPRIGEILCTVNPRLVFRVGGLAKQNLPDKFLAPLARLEKVVDIIHPAFILRSASKDKDYKATVNRIILAAKHLGFGA